MSLPSALTTKTLGTTEQVVLKRYGTGMIEFTPKLVTTGTTTSGSATITSVVSTNGITTGMAISGTGIPSGATVLSFVADTSITLSANATANGTGVTVTVTKLPLTNMPFRSTTLGASEFLRKLFDALNGVA